jgi:formylmethanofuran dehydrogenase subunit E
MADKAVLSNKEFQDVVQFHGCYCLDIAMGYRVSKALVREMGSDLADMKAVFARVGTPTCAVDAIQKITGCTFGKRNLIMMDLGKSVFMLQNTKTGKAVRAYCHYWDNFDHSKIRAVRKEANSPGATEQAKTALKEALDDSIAAILSLPEEQLFRIEQVSVDAPPKSSKYESAPCGACGEYTNVANLIEKGGVKVCPDCARA